MMPPYPHICSCLNMNSQPSVSNCFALVVLSVCS